MTKRPLRAVRTRVRRPRHRRAVGAGRAGRRGHNANLVGGDIGVGANNMFQRAHRAAAVGSTRGPRPYHTPTSARRPRRPAPVCTECRATTRRARCCGGSSASANDAESRPIIESVLHLLARVFRTHGKESEDGRQGPVARAMAPPSTGAVEEKITTDHQRRRPRRARIHGSTSVPRTQRQDWS